VLDYEIKLKFWQHLLIYFFCIFVIAGFLFHVIASIHTVIKNKPLQSISFYKDVEHIIKYTDFEKKIFNIDLILVLIILFRNIMGVLFIFFVPIIAILFLLKNSEYLSEKIYLFLIFLFIFIQYIEIILFYTKGYWLVYNIFPITESSVISFFWSRAIFHGFFEVGLSIVLLFYYINIFLYLYNNKKIDYNVSFLEIKKRFTILKRNIPLIILVLLIAAIIESMDLGLGSVNYFQ